MESDKRAAAVLAPAYYKLNVSRSHPLASRTKLLYKRCKRFALHAIMSAGRLTLPETLRAVLWKRYGQRFFT